MKNQNSDTLTLRVITPDQPVIDLECDSVRLTLADDKNGRGSGAYGIHCGHAKALLLLSPGPLAAWFGNRKILEAECTEGFARVEDNVVSVVVEHAKKNGK